MNLWRKPFFFFPFLPLLRRAKRIRAKSLYAEGVGDGQMDLHACFNIQIRVSFPTVQFFFFFGLVAILSVARAKDEVISYPSKSSPEI